MTLHNKCSDFIVTYPDVEQFFSRLIKFAISSCCVCRMCTSTHTLPPWRLIHNTGILSTSSLLLNGRRQRTRWEAAKLMSPWRSSHNSCNLSEPLQPERHDHLFPPFTAKPQNSFRWLRFKVPPCLLVPLIRWTPATYAWQLSSVLTGCSSDQ